MFEKNVKCRLMTSFVWLVSFLLLSFFPLCRLLNLWLMQSMAFILPNYVSVALASLAGIFWIAGSIGSVFKSKTLLNGSFSTLFFSGLTALLCRFYSDMGLLALLMLRGQLTGNFPERLSLYLSQEKMCYFVVLGCFGTALLIKAVFGLSIKKVEKAKKWLARGMGISIIVVPFLLSLPLPLLNTFLLWSTHASSWAYMPDLCLFFLNTLSVLCVFCFFSWGYYRRIILNITRFQWLQWVGSASAVFGLIIAGNVVAFIANVILLNSGHDLSKELLLSFAQVSWISLAFPLFPILLAFFSVSLFRLRLKLKLFDETDKANETSGYFGSAVFATTKDYKEWDMYDERSQIFVGMDEEHRLLYTPLMNKVTISPEGGGKSAASAIGAALDYDGPIFAFDPKGEIAAVTARYRMEVMKRKVIIIDPFGITRTPAFSDGKPEEFKKEYRFNPFDWIPEDRLQRDRVLNNFAASFIINEGGNSNHFDENAKILIRGYIDHMLTLSEDQRNLKTLYEMMSESIDDATLTFQQMAASGGRAKAASNQINRVGSDERGSILSTSYRQIDWIGDSNLQNLLSESNFDLREFLAGNMDIFVVVPEDQTVEHSRLVRMLMALLLGLIVQADPRTLPQKKMLFLLDELAQLGYCPDVEQCIQVLRARGVIVWCIFQTLSQIELFEKPDLFKGAAIKQIFTNDDTETMEWIQLLGCKKTVITKSVSTNKGQSKQNMQMFTNSTSSGEGESVQETGVDLIALNEIRELPKDDQFIFIRGKKPIRCKKAWYFNHPHFAGKFDPNPLETKSAS